MRKTCIATLTAVLVSISSLTFAAEQAPTPDKAQRAAEINGDNPEQGWFFFKDLKKKEDEKDEPKPEPAAPPVAQQAAKKQPPKCTTPATWAPDCGFVNPGKDFAFQEKQRDVLLQQMVMSNNDPKAVESFQYYMKWATERAAEVASLWYYNMVQNPDLDPAVKQPVSSFGLRLMTDVKTGKSKDVFSSLKQEGAFLVYFSRNDCQFCHDMAPIMRLVSKNSGLEVRNAAIDATCIQGFEAGCMTAPETLAPAQALQVSIVPAVFLYVPGGGGTWLRVATGLTDADTLGARVVSFFSAYRNALLKGVDNGVNGRAPVDFSSQRDSMTGTAAGVAGATAGAGIEMPSEAQVAEMLGKRK